MNMETSCDSDGFFSVDVAEVQMEINARSLLMTQEREPDTSDDGSYTYRIVSPFHSAEDASVIRAALPAVNAAAARVLNDGQVTIDATNLLGGQQGEHLNNLLTHEQDSQLVNNYLSNNQNEQLGVSGGDLNDWTNLEMQLVEAPYTYAALDPFDPTVTFSNHVVPDTFENRASSDMPELGNSVEDGALAQHLEFTQEDANIDYNGSIHCQPWSLQEDLDLSSDESMKDLSDPNGTELAGEYDGERFQLTKVFDGNLLKAAFPLLFDNIIRRGRYNHSRFNWLTVTSLDTLEAMEKRLYFIVTRLDEPIGSVHANRLHLEMECIYAQSIDILGPGEPDE